MTLERLPDALSDADLQVLPKRGPDSLQSTNAVECSDHSTPGGNGDWTSNSSDDNLSDRKLPPVTTHETIRNKIDNKGKTFVTLGLKLHLSPNGHGRNC